MPASASISFPTFAPAPARARSADAVTRYCAAIRAAGGEPVFYEMAWGRTEREAEGRARIFDLAVKNRIRFFAALTGRRLAAASALNPARP